MFILFFLINFAWAETTESHFLGEKTFSRDNTFCSHHGKRVEIEIRGASKFTDLKEFGSGEYAFYLHNNKRELLPVNPERGGSYKLFKGKKGVCSKSLGFAIDKNTIAILFLKLNTPNKEKLSIQLFDFKKFRPKEAIETEYLVDKVDLFPGGFVFAATPERFDSDMGTINLKGNSFIYQDRQFVSWVSYTSRGLEIQPSITYQNFEWKELFKNEEEFLKSAGWIPAEKKFSPSHLYIAVNHAQKTECLAFFPLDQKPTESLNWRCHQKI